MHDYRLMYKDIIKTGIQNIFLKKYSIYFSLALHMFLTSLFCISFEFSTQTYNIGDPQTPIVHSYFYNDKVKPCLIQQEKSLTKKNLEKNITNKAAIALNTIQHPMKNESEQNQTQSVAPQNLTSNGQQTSELIALLHAAIQKQQHYPSSALEMGREGRTTLSFILNPDGTINTLRVTHSSGTSSLDTAALASVRAAIPFQQVNKYLHQAQEYSIDVDFELT